MNASLKIRLKFSVFLSNNSWFSAFSLLLLFRDVHMLGTLEPTELFTMRMGSSRLFDMVVDFSVKLENCFSFCLSKHLSIRNRSSRAFNIFPKNAYSIFLHSILNDFLQVWVHVLVCVLDWYNSSYRRPLCGKIVYFNNFMRKFHSHLAGWQLIIFSMISDTSTITNQILLSKQTWILNAASLSRDISQTLIFCRSVARISSSANALLFSFNFHYCHGKHHISVEYLP